MFEGAAPAGVVGSWRGVAGRGLSLAFDRRACELSGAHRLIDRVSKIYQPDGTQIIAIEFAGNEREMLAESAAIIVTFFGDLVSLRRN